MSVIEKALEKSGLTMEADRLPPKQRTVKAFQRLIAAMRAAESEVYDRLSDSERQLNESLRQNLALQQHVRELEGKLLRHELADRFDQIGSLTVADKTRLLECAGV